MGEKASFTILISYMLSLSFSCCLAPSPIDHCLEVTNLIFNTQYVEVGGGQVLK